MGSIPVSSFGTPQTRSTSDSAVTCEQLGERAHYCTAMYISTFGFGAMKSRLQPSDTHEIIMSRLCASCRTVSLVKSTSNIPRSRSNVGPRLSFLRSKYHARIYDRKNRRDPAMAVYVRPRSLESCIFALPRYSPVDEGNQVFFDFLEFIFHMIAEMCLMSAKVRSRVATFI